MRFIIHSPLTKEKEKIEGIVVGGGGEKCFGIGRSERCDAFLQPRGGK